MRNRTLTIGILSVLSLSACAAGSRSGDIGMGHMQMGNGMMGRRADDSAFLPGMGDEISSLPEALPSQTIDVADGQTVRLDPTLVKKTINGRSIAMYGYDGQIPGPLLRVKQGSTFTVDVTNRMDIPTSIHWHGIRLDNANDGAVGVTQKEIAPGASFRYTVRVPDEGMYWYHPHVREDVQQDMGLYGNLLVTPQSSTAYAPVNGERAIILDDILLGEDGLPPPYGTTDADHALMGRYGNALLINGENAADLHAQKGSVLRLFLTNAANTRTFRIRIQKSDRSQAPAAMKLVGADGGHYERETFTDAVTLAPSERAIVDVLLPEAGYYDIVHEPSLASPRSPRLFLGHIEVADTPADPSYATAFGALRTNADVVSGIDPFRSSFDKQPDHVLHLSSRLKMMGGMGHGGMMMGGQPLDGIEWEDPLPMMNAMATKANTQWKLIDEAMKKENMDIDYSFNIGDKVKIRIVNDGEGDGSDHAMQHPIHFHGQRFLVLSEDGEKNEDLAWKDTVLVPKGRTIDILIDASNPGDWMFHCHIAEHLSNGMMGRFSVRE